MTNSNRSTPERRRRQRAAAEALAMGQGGVITREQLHRLGMSSAAILANLGADRWQELGVHCIVVHTGPLTDDARHWAAVLEAGTESRRSSAPGSSTTRLTRSG
jgi:predicted metal-dependent phosphotriesterase family hydrolase